MKKSVGAASLLALVVILGLVGIRPPAQAAWQIGSIPAQGSDPLFSPVSQPQPETWIAGETSVSGLSPEERARLCGVPEEVIEWERLQASRGRSIPEIPGAYPATVDWRNVSGQDWTTPIRDQAACGSCVAFGTIGSIESRMEITDGNPSLNPDLSEAHLFYCGCGNCCGSGWTPSSAMNFARDTGIVDEACFPYTDYDQPCNPCADWQTRVTKIAGWEGVDNAAAMKQVLADGGPVEATFTVYDDFFSYTGGIYRYTWGNAVGGHAIVVVGYNDTEGYWIAKNSWGTGWGEDADGNPGGGGWFRIAYGECGIDDYMYVPSISLDCNDPHEPNDETGQATPIAYGDTVNDPDICPAGDVDYYSFSGSAGDVIAADIDAQAIGSSLNSHLCLYDGQVSELACNDDHDGLDSYLEYTLPADDTYYLEAREYNHGNEGGPDYYYTLSLSKAGECYSILFDETHGVQGGFTIGNLYGELAAFLEGHGHTVDALQDPDPFDYATISQYDVLVLVLPLEFYSAAEKNAILQFVDEGRRLVTIGEWGGYAGISLDILNNVHGTVGDALIHNFDEVYDPTDFEVNDYWPLIHVFSPDPVNGGVGTVVESSGSSLDASGPAYGTAFGDTDTYTLLSAKGVESGTAAPGIERAPRPSADSSPPVSRERMPEVADPSDIPYVGSPGPAAPRHATDVPDLSDIPHAGSPGTAAPGDVLENFPNTWDASTIGLVYDQIGDGVVYAHESDSGGAGLPTLHYVDYTVPHPWMFSWTLSGINPNWPPTLNNRDGAAHHYSLDHLFLPDYNGDLSIADDNIIETTWGGTILNAWETDGAGNDSYDGSFIDQIIDIAIVPGVPDAPSAPIAHHAAAGRGEWLYRSEKGVLLATNQGGEALAYPAAYRWEPAAPSQLNALVYADDWIHPAPNTYVDQALQAWGIPYTAHYDGDFAGFAADLSGGGPWDLVIFANDNYPSGGVSFPEMLAYVQGGGKLAAEIWTMQSDYTDPLYAEMGVSYVANDLSSPPVYWWYPGHNIFNIPETAPPWLTRSCPAGMSCGQYLEPVAGLSDALAGYTPALSGPGQTALTLRQDEQTVFKGFLDVTTDADDDTDGTPDAVELWMNIAQGLLYGFGQDPTRYFVTAGEGSSVVYEINLIKAGWWAPNSWGTVRTCTVPGLVDNVGIDFDADHGVLYHSDASSTTIVVTDLDCNVIDTFTCNSPAGINHGVTFVEGKVPPEIWVTDYSSNSTTRCQAPQVIVQAMSNVGAGTVFAIGDADLWANHDSDWDGIPNVYEYDNAQLAWNVFAFGQECVNTPPIIDGLPDVIVDETTILPVQIDLWAYASDAETPDSGLTYTIEGVPSPGAGVSIVGNRWLTIDPSATWCSFTDVVIRVTDPGGLWDEDWVRVAVTWSCLG